MKATWLKVAVAFVALVCVFFAGVVYQTSLNPSQNTPVVQGVIPVATSTAPIPTPQLGIVKSYGSGTIVIQTSYSATKTYAVDANTALLTVVPPGGIGKGAASLLPGVPVIVYPSKSDAAKAASVAFVRDSKYQPSTSESVNSLSGIVTAITGSTITIQTATAGGETIATQITIAPTTQILSVVTTGSKGIAQSGIKVGQTVSASGIATVNGAATPSMFQLLTPISN